MNDLNYVREAVKSYFLSAEPAGSRLPMASRFSVKFIIPQQSLKNHLSFNATQQQVVE